MPPRPCSTTIFDKFGISPIRSGQSRPFPSLDPGISPRSHLLADLLCISRWPPPRCSKTKSRRIAAISLEFFPKVVVLDRAKSLGAAPRRQAASFALGSGRPRLCHCRTKFPCLTGLPCYLLASPTRIDARSGHRRRQPAGFCRPRRRNLPGACIAMNLPLLLLFVLQ